MIYTDMRVLRHHRTGHLSMCIWYQACKEFSAVSFACITGILWGFSCCLAQASRRGGVKCDRPWSDQCVKHTRFICKYACVFTNAVMLLMTLVCVGKLGTCLLWPVHPSAISNIKGIYSGPSIIQTLLVTADNSGVRIIEIFWMTVSYDTRQLSFSLNNSSRVTETRN